MSGVGISAGEIIRAVNLAREIYRKCFVEEPAAVKYRRFLEHIQVLGNSLERLNSTVQQYERQFPRREWHAGARQNDAAPDLWLKLAGDFHQTLMECASLLNCFGSLRNGHTKIASNLRWWLQVEPEVDRLMARLQFHRDQVETYCNPTNMQVALRRDREIQQLRRQVANLERIIVHGVDDAQTPWARILSLQVKDRLQLEFDTNRPPWSNDETVWPLRESFKAFAFHFQRGTVHFTPNPESGNITSVMQHLNFTKAFWILEKIRESTGFRAVDVDSIYSDTMREFEGDVRVQLHRYERGEIQYPTEQQLLGLSSEKFAISTNQVEETDLQDSCAAGILEEEILQIDLKPPAVNQKSSLTVFREGNTDFRIMISTELQQGSRLVQRYDNHPVTERHRIIPAYASPKSGLLLGHKLVIVNERGDGKRTIELTEGADVKNLQRAFTGYRIHHEVSLNRWCINSSDKIGNVGKGSLVQLWQFKPLPPVSTANVLQSSDGTISSESLSSSTPSFGLPMPSVDSRLGLASIFEGDSRGRADIVDSPDGFNDITGTNQPQNGSHLSSCNDRGSRMFQNGSNATESADMNSSHNNQFINSTRSNSRIFRNREGSQETSCTIRTNSGTISRYQSSVQSPVKVPEGHGVELLKPQLPVLVILTMSGGKFSFLRLTLEESTYVEPKSCGCRNKKKSCDRVVFESSRKSFEIHEFNAEKEGDSGFESWDISIFRNPPSEKSRKATARPGIKTLELRFLNETEKDVFLEALRSLENVRTVNYNEYVKNLKEKRLRDAKNSLKGF